MEVVTIQELGVILNNIPDVFSVVVNIDELEYENNNKLFQFALKSEILDDLDDVFVYTADFDRMTQTIRPLRASTFDNEGVFRKELFDVFPPVYRKSKDSLIIVQ